MTRKRTIRLTIAGISLAVAWSLIWSAEALTARAEAAAGPRRPKSRKSYAAQDSKPKPSLAPSIAPPPAPSRARLQNPPADRPDRSLIGRAKATYYCLRSASPDMGKPDTRLCEADGSLLAVVPRRFAEQARLQGSAKLADGRVINVATRNCACGFRPCFSVVDPDHSIWGMGAYDNPLLPYRTVAVDRKMIALGTPLYVPELDGLPIPSRYRAENGGATHHDGCVEAGDVGSGIRGPHIDLFTGDCAESRQSVGIPHHVHLFAAGDRCS